MSLDPDEIQRLPGESLDDALNRMQGESPEWGAPSVGGELSPIYQEIQNQQDYPTIHYEAPLYYQ